MGCGASAKPKYEVKEEPAKASETAAVTAREENRKVIAEQEKKAREAEQAAIDAGFTENIFSEAREIWGQEDALTKLKAAEGSSVWRCTWKDGVGIRSQPELTAPMTGEGILYNHSFGASSELTRTIEGVSITFLQLADGRGWVFDQDLEGEVCVKVKAVEEDEYEDEKEEEDEYEDEEDEEEQPESEEEVLDKVRRWIEEDNRKGIAELEKQEKKTREAEQAAIDAGFTEDQFKEARAFWSQEDALTELKAAKFEIIDAGFTAEDALYAFDTWGFAEPLNELKKAEAKRLEWEAAQAEAAAEEARFREEAEAERLEWEAAQAEAAAEEARFREEEAAYKREWEIAVMKAEARRLEREAEVARFNEEQAAYQREWEIRKIEAAKDHWQCIRKDGVGIRSQPNLHASLQGELECDETVVVSETFSTNLGVRGIIFLRLEDGRGWVPERDSTGAALMCPVAVAVMIPLYNPPRHVEIPLYEPPRHVEIPADVGAMAMENGRYVPDHVEPLSLIPVSVIPVPKLVKEQRFEKVGPDGQKWIIIFAPDPDPDARAPHDLAEKLIQKVQLETGGADPDALASSPPLAPKPAAPAAPAGKIAPPRPPPKAKPMTRPENMQPMSGAATSGMARQMFR